MNVIEKILDRKIRRLAWLMYCKDKKENTEQINQDVEQKNKCKSLSNEK
jgi:hypothetical protein